MASRTHNDEGIGKNNNLLLFFGGTLYLANLGYYGYTLLISLGKLTPSSYGLKALDFLTNKLYLFSTPYLTLLSALFLIGLFIWGHRRDKTAKYTPPLMMKVWLPLLVKLKIHPEFEYDELETNIGTKKIEKTRERCEGQFCVFLGIVLVLVSPIFTVIGNTSPTIKLIGFVCYVLTSGLGIAYTMLGGNLIHSMHNDEFGIVDKDVNNNIQESFMQETELIENQYSVNLKTQFRYKNKILNGYINVVNPFRATQVLGTPGSGKTYAIINEFIRQHIRKQFSMYCYDFKYPDLSTIVYNNYRFHKDLFRKKYGIEPKFCLLNFDDPRRSLRCNPISPMFLNSVTDAYDSSYTIMTNLNKTWVQKQGDFFVESAVNYLTACMWFLRKYKSGRFCTLPHVIEFAMSSYMDLIPVLSTQPELTAYVSNFFNSWEGGAQDQLQGQIASTQIALARISSPDIYWVLSGDDFTLDINNPEEPKILCIGNNPEKKDIYAAALGLYNGRILKIINKKGQHPISLIIDELPTMYVKDLDNLIATARSNKVAVVLGYQDYSQLKRDYGEKEATAIINTIGNTFAGLVTGETAKSLQDQFGRSKQSSRSVSTNESGESVSISEHMELLIPASKIATLSQGCFVGTVSDNFGEDIEEKRFNARILINNDVVKHEESLYEPIPEFKIFDNAKVAIELCEVFINFVSDNVLSEDLLSSGNLCKLSQIIEQKEMGSEVKVAKVLSLLFTNPSDLKHNRNIKAVDYFAKVGKENLKKLMNLEGSVSAILAKEVESAASAESLVKQTLKSIEQFENEIAEWIELEKNSAKYNASDDFVINSITVCKKTLKQISVNGYENVRTNVKEAIKKCTNTLKRIFTRYIRLKDEMWDIRNERMKNVITSNYKNIRADIDEILKDVKRDLFFNHYDLWDRRNKIMRNDEAEELEKIGLRDEVIRRNNRAKGD